MVSNRTLRIIFLTNLNDNYVLKKNVLHYLFNTHETLGKLENIQVRMMNYST